MASWQAKEQHKWTFLQLQSLRRDFATFTIEDKKLRIQFTDGSWAESNGLVEMDLQDILSCQSRFCLSPFQFLWVGISLMLTWGCWYMLTEYHGWREGILNDIICTLGILLFCSGSVLMATKQRTITIKTDKLTVEARVMDTLMPRQKTLQGLMEYIQQENPHCQIS